MVLELMKLETGITILKKINTIITLAIMVEPMSLVSHVSFMQRKEFGCTEDGDTFHDCSIRTMD